MADDSSVSGDETKATKRKEPEEVPTTIADDSVLTKYSTASEITNRVLKEIVDKCLPGASSTQICEFGDLRIIEETGKVFKKDKNMKKGSAFPTCLSANHCICHFSPLKSDPDYILKDGDLLKIDLGCHIDGFIAVVAHTIVIGACKEKKVDGRKADAILAAYYAAEAAVRIIKPESTNFQVTEAIDKCAESYKCKPVEGMLSYQLEKDIIDGDKRIIQNPNEAQKKEGCEKCEFKVNEVYAIDVLVSSGDGKPRPSEVRTTVYKKKDIIYQLKMKASRAFLNEVEKKFNLMPFTLRVCEDEKMARLGVIECAKHDLVEPYPVYYEKEGEFVAEFKYTVLLLPSGTIKITGLPLDLESFHSEHKITDEAINLLLSKSTSKKANKKKKKKNKSKAGQSEAGATNEEEGEDED